MTETRLNARAGDAALADRVARVLREMSVPDPERAREEFEHLLGRSRDLVERKLAMHGTKSETRDLISEIVFSRLRRAFRGFLATGEVESEVKSAEWVMGAVVGSMAMVECAAAVDAAILEGTGPQDYSFAGRCDFIALEEVLQMLGAGKHCGCLSLEKDDNRLDIYINRGQIAFLDPHHIVRRVLPGATPMQYREIPADALELAERRHSREGIPSFVTLVENGVFRRDEARAVMEQLGTEVLFDFLREQEQSRFLYRRFDRLPDFARDYEQRMGITPILLELSKRLDEWRSMTRAFPDPSAPIEPMPDMLARISELSLGVLEIKTLTMINGENSPHALTEMSGLPLFDIYKLLVTFAQEGAIVVPGGEDSLFEINMSAEESVESALEALDENDDHVAMNSALDRVLGDL